MIINTKGKLKKKHYPSHQLPLASVPLIDHPSYQLPIAKVFYNVIETLSAASRSNPSELSYRQELHHKAGIYSGSEKTLKNFNIDCVYKSLR